MKAKQQQQQKVERTAAGFLKVWKSKEGLEQFFEMLKVLQIYL